MDGNFSGTKIITGNGNKKLAQDIAAYLELPLCNAEVLHFSDGEIGLNIHESVRGSDVFVIQPTSAPCNDNLMELLILIDALKRASAGRITASCRILATLDRTARRNPTIRLRLSLSRI